ncbi:probable glutathione S-transferase GSTF1 [Phoenix dactylifera]|uniref:glutathione transferase n=1 Tax=Phoenix dactylifera TaxID=42345 RepID=A0A8B9A1T6_PHODC|nr:probable glutathione S-transferase GSTF1 [Phoenix dactylifera]
MGVKVYGPPTFTSTARVIAALEEMGADYEVVPIDFAAGEHKHPAHLARNPFGQVPAFEDGDLMLFESRAIARYVARKHKSSGPDLLREGNLQESAMVDLWLEVESQQYNPIISSIVYECLISPIYGGVPDRKLIDANVEKLGKLLDLYEDRLSKTKFLAGDFFSLADLNHMPYSQYFMATPHASLFESRPHVKAWWEDLSSRPAVRKTTAGMPKSG